MPVATVRANNTHEDGTNQTSHTVNLPTGRVNGNTMIVYFAFHSDNFGISWPAGWTVFYTNDFGGLIQSEAAWRELDGSEGDTITVTTTAGAPSASIALECQSADDPDTNPPESVVGTNASSANPDPTTLTPGGGADDYLYIALECHDRSTRTTDAYPSNCPDDQITAGAGGASGLRMACATSGETSSSSFDPATFTLSASANHGAGVLCVYPGAAPPGAGGHVGFTGRRRRGR